MKKIFVLLFIFILSVHVLTAQKYRKEYNLPENVFIYEHFPWETFKGDTTAYLMINYYFNGRYNNKKIEFFFKEFEKDFPIKSVWFVQSGEEPVAFFFFYETKEDIMKKLKADKPIRAIEGSFEELPAKEKIPELCAYLEKWGFDCVIDMTDELRNLLKNEIMHYVIFEDPSEHMQIELGLKPPTKYYKPKPKQKEMPQKP